VYAQSQLVERIRQLSETFETLALFLIRFLDSGQTFQFLETMSHNFLFCLWNLVAQDGDLAGIVFIQIFTSSVVDGTWFLILIVLIVFFAALKDVKPKVVEVDLLIAWHNLVERFVEVYVFEYVGELFIDLISTLEHFIVVPQVEIVLQNRTVCTSCHPFVQHNLQLP